VPDDAALVVEDIDQVKAYELYALLAGDVAQVAVALRVSEASVARVAQQHDWPGKLRRDMSGDVARGLRKINRARCAVQSARLSRVLDGVLEDMEATPERVAEWTTVYVKGVAMRTGGPLMQIAAAIETAQNLSYKALGDDPDKRAEETSNAAAAESGDMLLAMQSALQRGADALRKPAGELASAVSSEGAS